jgi:probable HAF family extracellular repeat protein
LATNGTTALGINAAGLIVGYYVDASNKMHGFLYTTYLPIRVVANANGAPISPSSRRSIG